jgi:hypothetical protein
VTARKGRDFVPFGRGAWEEVLPNERSALALLFRLTMAADYETGEVEGSEVEIASFIGWRRHTFRKYLAELGDEVEVVKGVNRFDKGRFRIVHYNDRLGGVAGRIAGRPVRPSSGTYGGSSYNVPASTDGEAIVPEEVQDSVSRSLDRSLSASAAKNAPPDAGEWERKKQKAHDDLTRLALEVDLSLVEEEASSKETRR